MITRTARPDELDAILDLWGATGLGLRPTDAPGSLEGLIENDPDALVVAEEDGRIVGTLIAAWDGWRGNMYRLGVLPQYRRRGIASELVRAGERHLFDRGSRRVVAAVGDENSDATAFWRAVGYEMQDVHRLVKDLG